MEKSSWFLEIFADFDVDQAAPVIHPPTRKFETQLDDPLWPFLPGSGKADAFCRQAMDADFVAGISGCTEDQARKVVMPVRSSLNDLVANLVKRATRVQRTAPLRKRAIQSIVDRFRNRPEFSAIRDSEGWDRLVGSCEKVVAEAVTSA